MKALITGGAGFIGSHLAEALLERGDEVYILDDLSTGAAANLPAQNGHGRQHAVFESVLNRPVLTELVNETDVTFHLAAAVGVRLVMQQPLHTIETNIKATELVLEAAAAANKRVFVASTSEVYGKNTAVPFREDANLVMGPTTAMRWAYACSKAIDEFLALAYFKQRRLPVTIGRFFNVVGPRQSARYGMVLPTLVSQALASEPLTVFGDGRQTRCFGYVSEVVEAVLRLAANDRAVGEIVNIGNDQEISMVELAHLVKQKTSSASEIHFIPYEQAYEPGFEDMRRRTPCLDKLLSLTGFRPTMPLAEIVQRLAHSREREREELGPELHALANAVSAAAADRLAGEREGGHAAASVER